MEICEQRSPAVERSFPDLSEGYQQLGLPSTEKAVIAVEVCLKSKTTVRHEEIRLAVERMLDKRSLVYEDGPIPISESDEPFLFEHVQSITICDTDGPSYSNGILLFWQVTLEVHVYQLNEEGPGEELEANESIASFHEWSLPAREFHGLWESLIYDSSIKQQLLRYAATALLFSDKGVDPNLISSNRVILLHGPPGTGKTSICKALGQKLSIRCSHRYTHSQLVEVNAHSLFSKWFSESGKLVTKLFQKLQDIVEDGTTLVFVLIDEVESLTAARQAAFSGSEPSDSIRVVNALLTQLDTLKSWPNVFVLTTSNICAAVDVAFVDRADIKAYIGPPSVQARYEILKSCLRELRRVGIICQATTEPNALELLSFKVLLQKINDIADNQQSEVFNRSRLLLTIADACELSGISSRIMMRVVAWPLFVCSD